MLPPHHELGMNRYGRDLLGGGRAGSALGVSKREDDAQHSSSSAPRPSMSPRTTQRAGRAAPPTAGKVGHQTDQDLAFFTGPGPIRNGEDGRGIATTTVRHHGSARKRPAAAIGRRDR